MAEKVQWQKLHWTTSDHPSSIQPIPISIGSSIWIAKNKGWHPEMVEYHPDSGTISPKIPYPAHFNKVDGYSSNAIVSCKYKEDSIILLDHAKQCCIVFDTKTREYFDISPFTGPITSGHRSSCITAGDYIHIFDGTGRREEYTICSIKDNTSRSKFPEQKPQHYEVLVPVIKTNGSYKSSSKKVITGFIRKQSKNRIPSVLCDIISKFCRFELIKFGGARQYVKNCGGSWQDLDSFYIGTLKDDDAAKPIEWHVAPEYTLKYPLSYFGYVQHGAFIVIFGGKWRTVPEDGLGYGKSHDSQDIFILDLSKKSGWIQSPVECPRKGVFHAVLDQGLRVHLLTQRPSFDKETQKYEQEHYCMKLRDIIPQSMYTEDAL